MKNVLINLGLRQSLGDSCIFYFHHNSKLDGIILIYVDDLLASGSQNFEKSIMKILLQKFCFGDELTKDFTYTGISIHQKDNGKIRINQDKFSQSLPCYEFSQAEPDHILGKDENNLIRSSIGQLNWLSSQTRPDLAYDTFCLSTCLNKATSRDAKLSNKVVQKSKNNQVQLKFSHLDFWKNLHLELYVDAPLGNIEQDNMTKSMMGYFLVLCDEKGNFNPLH